MRGETWRSAPHAYVVNYVISIHADQLVRDPAYQRRGTPGHGCQYEPPSFPDRVFNPAWRYAATAGAAGLHAVAGIEGIAGTNESTATSSQFETGVAGRM